MFSQLLVNALIASSIYALVGVGFSLIYQVQRFFHFTHGLAYALGAYATFAFIKLGLPMFAAATLGICASGIFGILLDVCMIAPVRKHNGSALVLLLASIGAYIVGQNLISIFLGDDLKTLGSGNVSAGFQIFNARITSDQIVIIAGSAVAIAAVALWLYVSHFGKQIRTIACDEQLAVILGMPVGRIRLVVMAVGSGLAGLAGIFSGINQAIVPTMGMSALLAGVVAMIVGGRTSMLGAAAGGLIIGIAENMCAIWLPLAWQDAVVFVILILFLLLRPQGLFGQPLRQATI